MQKKVTIFVLLVVILVSTACSFTATATPTQSPATEAPTVASTPTSTSYSITDAMGRTITFEKVPERIVIVGKALFMVADAVYTFPNVSDRIIATGSTSQSQGNFIPLIDPNAAAKATLTGDTVGPEQIAAANPDLVILKSSNSEKLGAPLEALGIPVVYVDFETPEQYTRDLTTLGQLFQNETRAQEVAKFYTGKVASITSITSKLTDDQKPSVLVIYYNEKDGEVAFNVPPMSWIQTTEVIDAGGNPIWKGAELGNGWTKVTIEQIAAWNPDVVFIVSYFKPIGDVITALKADPQWSELKAVKGGKLYGFATDVFSWDQADTRWILGLTWMAGKLHPDLFPNLDIKQEAQNFYQTLYGMNSAAFESKIVPLFAGDLP